MEDEEMNAVVGNPCDSCNRKRPAAASDDDNDNNEIEVSVKKIKDACATRSAEMNNLVQSFPSKKFDEHVRAIIGDYFGSNMSNVDQHLDMYIKAVEARVQATAVVQATHDGQFQPKWMQEFEQAKEKLRQEHQQAQQKLRQEYEQKKGKFRQEYERLTQEFTRLQQLGGSLMLNQEMTQKENEQLEQQFMEEFTRVSQELTRFLQLEEDSLMPNQEMTERFRN